jgi:hypothetical protein
MRRSRWRPAVLEIHWENTILEVVFSFTLRRFRGARFPGMERHQLHFDAGSVSVHVDRRCKGQGTHDREMSHNGYDHALPGFHHRTLPRLKP